MRFFEYLGFLGLLGIAILILIYLIKPNYQQKVVSSTHVWKLSLKYRKKRLPINRFKNLLILICQILIITICSFLLAQPYLSAASKELKSERIVVIDASASMLAHQGNDVTRFERAVSQVKTLGREMINKKHMISVIVAGKEAECVLRREDNLDRFNTVLDSLVEPNENGLPRGCTFGPADIDGAMVLAENYLTVNPDAGTLLYSATMYENMPGVTRVPIEKFSSEYGQDKEWNAAILDCTMEYEDNYYTFSVEVASYNEEGNIPVYFRAYGVNGEDKEVEFNNGQPAMVVAECRDNKSVIVRFTSDLKINSYSSIWIYIEQNDSFYYDNDFYLYGNEKETISVAYVSSAPNIYYKGILSALGSALSSWWNIQYNILSLEQLEKLNQKLEGYDFYIIEYEIPDELPTDGVVLLINPEKMPIDSELILDSVEVDNLIYDQELNRLHPAESSHLMSLIDPNSIIVNKYMKVISYGDFTPLMYYKSESGSDPVFLFKNTDEEKIAVITYSSWYSDITAVVDFPIIMYNLLEYFFPVTIQKYIYDIDQPLVFDQRNDVLSETSPTLKITQEMSGVSVDYSTFPYNNIFKSFPGKYTIEQQLLSGRKVEEKYFVKVAASESDFTKLAAYVPPSKPPSKVTGMDLIVYFAAALVALVFLERLLHVKDEF